MGGPDGFYIFEADAEDPEFLGMVHLLKPLSQADTQALFAPVKAA